MGLNFFFDKIEGYHHGFCVEIYKNMKIDTTCIICSKVEGKTILITADTIAQYLRYPWPDPTTIQFLEGSFNPLMEQAYAQTVFMNPVDFKARSKFMLGKFKLEYKLITKTIH